MKKYVIAVGSEEISTQVQEALFRAGFKWELGGKRVTHTHDSFLFVSYFVDGILIRDSSSYDVVRDIKKGGVILLSSQEVIENPFQLDGAKKPVKEMTVAEIQEKLGNDVKVIDG